VGAGLESIRRALTVGSFHIINNPSILKRLRDELEIAIPNPDEMPPLVELKRLPYLTACIEECKCLAEAATRT
jgi:cytochrome P450